MNSILRTRVSICIVLSVLVLTALAAPIQGASARKAKKASAKGARHLVDVNAAGAEELETIPGVGTRMSHAIIDSRNQMGAFQTADDLARVKGLGSVNLLKVARYMTFPSGGVAGAAEPGLPGPRPSRPIDLNIATAGELANLPGMGWGLAYRVVAERERGGAFRTLDDLLYVTGVRQEHVRRWASYLFVEGHL